MTRPTFFVEEDKILSNLFEEGLENLHLYKPGASPMFSERLLTLLEDEYHNRISVHGHFYLKEEFHLRGIHIDDAHTEPPVGYKGNLSRTCHAIEELKEAKRHSNYVFLHSIYDSQQCTRDEGIGIRRCRHLRRPLEPLQHPQRDRLQRTAQPFCTPEENIRLKFKLIYYSNE